MKPFSYDQPFACLKDNTGSDIYVNMREVVAFKQAHNYNDLLEVHVGSYNSSYYLYVRCSEYQFISLLETVYNR